MVINTLENALRKRNKLHVHTFLLCLSIEVIQAVILVPVFVATEEPYVIMTL